MDQTKRISHRNTKTQLAYLLMLLPGIVVAIIFCYIPMYGVVIAFQKFVPAKGMFGPQKWVGFSNFKVLFEYPRIWTYMKNTVVIAFFKIILNIIVPVAFALQLNEVNCKWFKRLTQTVTYFPHFVSWIVFGGILIDVLSPSTGIINSFLNIFGIKPIYFLGDVKYVKGTVIITDIIKSFGYSSIVYLAALTSIDPHLYEAAQIDGANRVQQVIHVSIPGITFMIALMGVLSVGNILNAGFDQIWNLINNNTLYELEVLDTLSYRVGILNRNYSLGAAIGLLKSGVSAILIAVSYYFAYKKFDYRVF